MKSNIDTPVTTSVCWKFDGLICSIKDWSVQTSCMLVAWVCCTWLVFSFVKVVNQATIITVNLFNIQWVMNEWLRTCLWNLVLFFAEGTSGDELTLLQLAGKDTLMMKIIIIYITIISIMCFLLRLIFIPILLHKSGSWKMIKCKIFDADMSGTLASKDPSSTCQCGLLQYKYCTHFNS